MLGAWSGSQIMFYQSPPEIVVRIRYQKTRTGPMTPILHISLLGPFQVVLGEDVTSQFKTSKAKALLAYLACTKQTHSRHALAGLLWSEDSDTRAKNSLRVAISHLNKLLPGYLETNRLTVALSTEAELWLDVDEFACQIETLTHPHPDLEALQRALTLYRGDFLEDVAVEDSPAFLEWVTSVREQWHQHVRAVLQRVAHELSERRTYAAAIPVLQRLTELDLQNEDAHRRLMIAYGRTGQNDAALAQYEVCRQQLQAWLSVQPTPETTALYERIQEAQAHARREAPPPAGVSSASNAESPFVGRTHVLDQLVRLLQTPHVRLITITGLGGIGKTRLASAAVERLRTESVLFFLNGIVFVPLAEVESAEMLPLALAEALDLSLLSAAPAKAQLLEYLTNKEVLLVLDTFEHLLDGLPLLQEILSTGAHVKLLVTSREPLQLDSEWRIALEGLTQPDLDAAHDAESLAQFEAVEFFTGMAQAVQPAFQIDASRVDVLVRLCQLTAGNPLALQLTALWLRTMPLESIVARLEQNLDLLETEQPDWPLRQRSMRAILQSTHALLTPEEQRLFNKMAVFRGGFTETAVQEVAGANPYLLSALLDMGLLHMQHDPASTSSNGSDSSTDARVRYVLHELTRQYAAELLPPEQAAPLRARHSTFYADLLHSQRDAIDDRRNQQASREIGRELANIRAAWQWLVDAVAMPEYQRFALSTLERMIPTLAAFYSLRSLMQPGIELFEAAAARLAATIDALPPHAEQESPDLWRQMQTVWAQMQVRTAWFHLDTSGYDTVIQLAEPILARLRALALSDEIALLLTIVGRARVRRGQIAVARPQLQEAIDLYRQSGNVTGAAYALRSLGIAYDATGAYECAHQVYQESLAAYEALGYTPGIAQIYSNMGTTYGRAGDYQNALAYYHRALRIAEGADVRSLTMVNTSNIGSVHRMLNNTDIAATYVQRSLGMARELGNRRWVAANLQILADAYLRMDQRDRAARTAQEGIDTAHAIDSVPDLLGCAAVLAQTWARAGRLAETLRILYFVEQHPSTMARDRAYIDELFHELRAELPQTILDEALAWAESHAVDELVAWLGTVRVGT